MKTPYTCSMAMAPWVPAVVAFVLAMSIATSAASASGANATETLADALAPAWSGLLSKRDTRVGGNVTICL